jgi:hypothetical protein
MEKGNHRRGRARNWDRDREAELVRDRVRALRVRLRRGADIPEFLLRYLDIDTREKCRHGYRRGSLHRGTGMRSLRPVPWTALRTGTVVDAWVPFADGSGYKRRPAVVVDVVDGRVRLFPVTSQVSRVEAPGRRGTARRGMVIRDREVAGLRPEPSAVLWRSVLVDRTDVLAVVGSLAGADLAAVAARTGRPHRRAPGQPSAHRSARMAA